MKFFTWNTQGDFTNEATTVALPAVPSKAEIVKLFLNDGCDVGFIQEGGVGKARTAIPGATVYGGIGVGAKNERCTNYVLVRDGLFRGGARFEFFNVIGGGEAGRGVAAVRLGDAIFASWHSLSGKSNADTASLLDECSKKKDVNTIVIGGDFNTSPDEIENMILRKVGQRGWNTSWSCSVFNSAESTHHGTRGDSELDFFVVFRRNGFVKADAVVVERVPRSDHNPVIMSINL